MTIALGVESVGVTNVTFNISFAGGSGTIEIQISPRRDFQFCVCPIVSFPYGTPIGVFGLNQRGTYFARARTRLSNGVVEDWSNVAVFRTLDGPAQAVQPAAVMIEPTWLVRPIAFQGMASTGAVPGFPLENLAIDSPVAWRGLPNEQRQWAIYIDTGRQPVDTLALLNHNMPEAGAMIVGGGDTPPQALNGQDFSINLPVRASPNLPQRPGYHALASLGAVRRSRWISILFPEMPLPGGLMHIEHLVLGLNRVTKNHSVEKTETPVPLTTMDRRRSGVADRVRGLPMRKVDVELSMLTEAQYETVYGDLWRMEQEAVLVVPNSKSGAFLHDRILYGDLSGGRIVNVSSPRHTRGFTVTSLV